MSVAERRATSYTISVKTTRRMGVETDANVFLQLSGEERTGPVWRLNEFAECGGEQRLTFEAGQTKTFFVADQERLGELLSAEIWHDHSGMRNSWHLEAVDVYDSATGAVFHFPCHRWLAKDESDGRICRQLTCQKRISRESAQENVCEPTAVTPKTETPVMMWPGYPYGGYGYPPPAAPGYGYGYPGYPYPPAYGYRPPYGCVGPMMMGGMKGHSWSWSWS